jgi:hypothetical protein
VGAKNGDGGYGETAEPTMVFDDGKRSCRQLSFVPFALEEIEVMQTAANHTMPLFAADTNQIRVRGHLGSDGRRAEFRCSPSERVDRSRRSQGR